MNQKKKNEEIPKKGKQEIKAKSTEYNLENLGDIIKFTKECDGDEGLIQKGITRYIQKTAEKYEVGNFFWVFLYDESGSISSYHSGRIYRKIKEANEKKIAMFLTSPGGSIEPAYLISKICKSQSKNNFIVVVPRKAKSAATLISLGASEIHMGMLSELGPIDPQIGDLPALSMSNALEKIAEMSAKYPNASDMFAQYLNNNLNLRLLGYFERINESAVQYAERLLENASSRGGPTDVKQIADHFVNHYKNHAFVIDFEEAQKILGDAKVKMETKEYLFSNDIYSTFEMFKIVLEVFNNKIFRYVGNIEDGVDLTDKK